MADVSDGWVRLGRTIKGERSKHFRYQYEFADAAGISKETISALENGKQPMVKDETLIAVERALGWLPGSCRRIVAGGTPILPDDPDKARLDAGWDRLDARGRAWILSEIDRLAPV